MYRLYAYICFMWSNVCTDIDIRLINLSLRTRTTRNDDKWRAAMKRKRSPSQYLHSIRTYALIIIRLAVGSALFGIMSLHAHPLYGLFGILTQPNAPMTARSNMGRSLESTNYGNLPRNVNKYFVTGYFIARPRLT